MDDMAFKMKYISLYGTVACVTSVVDFVAYLFYAKKFYSGRLIKTATHHHNRCLTFEYGIHKFNSRSKTWIPHVHITDMNLNYKSENSTTW